MERAVKRLLSGVVLSGAWPLQGLPVLALNVSSVALPATESRPVAQNLRACTDENQ